MSKEKQGAVISSDESYSLAVGAALSYLSFTSIMGISSVLFPTFAATILGKFIAIALAIYISYIIEGTLEENLVLLFKKAAPRSAKIWGILGLIATCLITYFITNIGADELVDDVDFSTVIDLKQNQDSVLNAAISTKTAEIDLLRGELNKMKREKKNAINQAIESHPEKAVILAYKKAIKEFNRTNGSTKMWALTAPELSQYRRNIRKTEKKWDSKIDAKSKEIKSLLDSRDNFELKQMTENSKAFSFYDSLTRKQIVKAENKEKGIYNIGVSIDIACAVTALFGSYMRSLAITDIKKIPTLKANLGRFLMDFISSLFGLIGALFIWLMEKFESIKIYLKKKSLIAKYQNISKLGDAKRKYYNEMVKDKVQEKAYYAQMEEIEAKEAASAYINKNQERVSEDQEKRQGIPSETPNRKNKKRCLNCNTPFDATNPKKKYCSDSCRKRYNERKKKASETDKK